VTKSSNKEKTNLNTGKKESTIHYIIS